MNIKRSPLCGRNFEYYSEDPYLSGVLGAAHVNALQAAGPGASVKHFAANNQETERMRISADVDERTLREIYLPAFERVVTEASPATVMCSYNKINGVYASRNRWLLTDVLRGDWGFAGAVVSDWGAVSDRVESVRAGMDLEMPGSNGTTDAEIIDAVDNGQLDESTVDESVRRVLALTELPHTATGELDVDGHHQVARAGRRRLGRSAEEQRRPSLRSGVVDRGDRRVRHPAPIPGRRQLPHQRHPHRRRARRDPHPGRGSRFYRAVGSGIHARRPTSQAMRTRLCVQRPWRSPAPRTSPSSSPGLSDREESEGFDRTNLQLPDEQVELIRAVAASGTPTVVVLSNGGVVTLEGWHDSVDAIVEGWLLGQAGGGAIADVLFGVVNPSGHLAETIPLRLEDNPSWLNFPGEQGHVRYSEGVFVGYRYYTTAGVPVRYPFGHGLSYTTFETTELQSTVTGSDNVHAQVTVANTGDRAGKHVVQIYVATTTGPVRRPRRELRSFAKVASATRRDPAGGIRPGPSRVRVLGHRAGPFRRPAGEYTVQVCADASTVLDEQTVTLAGDAVIRELTMDSTVGDWFSHPVVGPALMAGLQSSMTPEQAEQAAQNPDGLKMVESMPMQQFLVFTNGAIPTDSLEQLIELSKIPAPAA